jgi:hypothetical protein
MNSSLTWTNFSRRSGSREDVITQGKNVPSQRVIYEPWEYWPIERNWARRYTGLTQMPTRARYRSYLYEVREEYVMRNRRILNSLYSDKYRFWLNYLYLFHRGLNFDPAPTQALFGDTTILLNCLSDTDLKLEFFFKYKLRGGDVIEIDEGDPEALLMRDAKTHVSRAEICKRMPPIEGSALLAEMEEKGDDLEVTPFFGHLSSFVDRGVLERSSFEVFARNFDLSHAPDLGWKVRPYEGAIPEPPAFKELSSKEIFVKRLSSWFCGGEYYSNLFTTQIEAILEDFGLEEIPPTSDEATRAKIRYMDESYTYPESYRESKIIYGTEAKLLTIFPPGRSVNAKEAEAIIIKHRVTR